MRHCENARNEHIATNETDKMKLVKSTSEILAFKALNRDINMTWVDWAVEMLTAGFDTENLTILAGESEPFNQFQLQDLTTKVLDELQLDYADKEQTIKNYVCYLIDKVLDKEIETVKALEILKDICIELGMEDYLMHFYLLYFTKTDLLESENQYYLDGIDRSNIDTVIADYFATWKINCATNE